MSTDRELLRQARDALMELESHTYEPLRVKIDAHLKEPPVKPTEINRPYGTCSISGPVEDVAFIMRHLPDVDDA